MAATQLGDDGVDLHRGYLLGTVFQGHHHVVACPRAQNEHAPRGLPAMVPLVLPIGHAKTLEGEGCSVGVSGIFAAEVEPVLVEG